MIVIQPGVQPFLIYHNIAPQPHKHLSLLADAQHSPIKLLSEVIHVVRGSRASWIQVLWR